MGEPPKGTPDRGHGGFADLGWRGDDDPVDAAGEDLGERVRDRLEVWAGDDRRVEAGGEVERVACVSEWPADAGARFGDAGGCLVDRDAVFGREGDDLVLDRKSVV